MLLKIPFTMVSWVTNLASPCFWQTEEPKQRYWTTMTESQKCNFFPQEPYYIPGYAGFYPQIRYQVGKTYGRTTSQLLTDPEIQRSPCSVLAPLIKPRFIEDFSQRRIPAHEMMDQYQSYIPNYTGFVPYQGDSPLPDIELRPPVPRAGAPPAPQSWPNANLTQLVEQRKYSPCHPGIRLSCGPGWRQFAASAGTQLVSEQGDRKMICHPDIPLVCGQEEMQGPCHTDIALSCGQGWRSTPFLTGTDQTTRIEAVPLPQATETVDVSRFGRTPKLDVPNLIQRKAISGYTGFIPRFTWIMGVNYLKGVKDAMNEFDCNQRTLMHSSTEEGMAAFTTNNQLIQNKDQTGDAITNAMLTYYADLELVKAVEKMRSPLYSFGKRFPHTYWPNTKIYNSRGLIPFYTGFVPTIRHNNALTFGNSTRKAYYDELLRRQQAA